MHDIRLPSAVHACLPVLQHPTTPEVREVPWVALSSVGGRTVHQVTAHATLEARLLRPTPAARTPCLMHDPVVPAWLFGPLQRCKPGGGVDYPSCRYRNRE